MLVMYGSPVGVKRNDATDVKVSTEVTDALSPCAAKDDARERDATDDRDAASSSVAVSVGSKKSVHGVSPSGCSRTSALCCACSSLSSALHVRERRALARRAARPPPSPTRSCRGRAGRCPALGPNLKGRDASVTEINVRVVRVRRGGVSFISARGAAQRARGSADPRAAACR